MGINMVFIYLEGTLKYRIHKKSLNTYITCYTRLSHVHMQPSPRGPGYNQLTLKQTYAPITFMEKKKQDFLIDKKHKIKKETNI